MAEGNGKSGLTYVLRDMSEAQDAMQKATRRLESAPFPDFTLCQAGGEEFHRAMADTSHAQSAGIAALLQWQTIQVSREIERSQSTRSRSDDQPEIKTKWGSIKTRDSLYPLAVIVLGVTIIVLVMKGYISPASASAASAAPLVSSKGIP